MAKKKTKKKSLKKKDTKKKDKRKKEEKKKSLKKKTLKKKDKKKKPGRKKDQGKKKKEIPAMSSSPAFGDHSSNYNVRDALKKLRSLERLEEVQAFTRGEERRTLTRAIPGVMRRLGN
jgi:hypothetical protein